MPFYKKPAKITPVVLASMDSYTNQAGQSMRGSVPVLGVGLLSKASTLAYWSLYRNASHFLTGFEILD